MARLLLMTAPCFIFYMKKCSGVLEIKLDKDENSHGGYYEIKSMCQEIKKVLVK